MEKLGTAVDKYKQAEENEKIQFAKYENMIAGNRTIDEADIEAVVNKVMLKKYPVGSIYCSVLDTDPGTFIGGTWTRISQGRVLMGATDTEEGGYVAGQTKNAGLPNITGSLGVTTYSNTGWTGAFRVEVRSSNQSFAGTANVAYISTFDASRSSSIYGASDTVQPPAYVVYMWQRTE